jgi:hypothetical protein
MSNDNHPARAMNFPRKGSARNANDHLRKFF